MVTIDDVFEMASDICEGSCDKKTILNGKPTGVCNKCPLKALLIKINNNKED